MGGFKDEKLKPATYTDMRKLLEDKSIDAVSIATPNHWHALAAIWAIQAGKDVYVEKPVSHNVWEGRQIVNAARKYNKIVQTGTQSRSSREGIFEAVKCVQAGNLGKILLSRGLCYKRRDSIGKTEGPQKVPDTINYDLWCGPAPLDPPRRNSKKGRSTTTGTGSGPTATATSATRASTRWTSPAGSWARWSWLRACGAWADASATRTTRETPNTQIVYQDYEKAPLIFEVHGLPSEKGGKDMDKLSQTSKGVKFQPKAKEGKEGDKKGDEESGAAAGAGVGVIVECEGGSIVVPNYSGATAFDKDGKEIKTWKGSEDHFKNFINACRSRRVEDLNADILEGHLSSALCHTGNISYRLGKKEQPDAIMEKIKGDRFAEESFERMKEHLSKNEVDVTKDLLTLGPPLKFDPEDGALRGQR